MYNHGHSNAKKRCAAIQKKLTNGLDFDDAGDLISNASDELSFIHNLNGRVWYVQNEDALLYIRDETDMNLSMLSEKFNHVKPPELREKFNI